MFHSGWTIWVIRFGITLAGTAMVAWKISFAVADQIVRAHNSSMNETLRSLQSSIDRLNTSVITSIKGWMRSRMI